MKKIFLNRFADEPSTPASQFLKINSEIKIDGTNRDLKTIDTDLSSVIALDATRVTVPIKL